MADVQAMAVATGMVGAATTVAARVTGHCHLGQGRVVQATAQAGTATMEAAQVRAGRRVAIFIVAAVSDAAVMVGRVAEIAKNQP